MFFSRMENFLEKNIEGFFNRKFSSNLQMVEIEKIIDRILIRQKKRVNRAIFVPDKFTITMSDEDFNQLNNIKYMSNFKQFEEAFNEQYESIYDFIDSTEVRNPVIPFNGKLIENGDETRYDSYGNEDSQLSRIFYFEEFDVNVMFGGTRCSYEGEEWDTMREVKQVQKTITSWE